FFSSRRRHTRSKRDWSSDVCSSDLELVRDREVECTAMLFGVCRDVCGEAFEGPRTPVTWQVQLSNQLLVELEGVNLGAILGEGECENLFRGAATRGLDQEPRILQHHLRVEPGGSNRFPELRERYLSLRPAPREATHIVEDAVDIHRRLLGAEGGSDRSRRPATEPCEAGASAVVLSHRHSPLVSITIFSFRSSRSISLKGS